MLKTPHDPTRIVPPKVRVAAVAALVTVAVAAGSATPVATGAMKMRHDCCVWAPTK